MEEKQQHGRWKYLMCIWFGIFCFPLIAIAAQGVIKVKGYFSEVQAIRQIEKTVIMCFLRCSGFDEVKRKTLTAKVRLKSIVSCI